MMIGKAIMLLFYVHTVGESLSSVLWFTMERGIALIVASQPAVVTRRERGLVVRLALSGENTLRGLKA
jgi:hypothetical protein